MRPGFTTLVDHMSASGAAEANQVPHPRGEAFSALVVGEDSVLREEISAQLMRLGATTVHQAASVPEATRFATRAHDLVILDLGLTGKPLHANGWPEVVALVPDDPAAVSAAFKAGARACLVRPAAPLAPPPPVAEVPSFELSAREIEVLQLAAEGCGNKEIGAALHLSALTVKSHLSRIGKKLNTGDRARMVLLAMRAGLVR